MSSLRLYSITPDNMNPNIRKLEYAVRGPIVTRAKEIDDELRRGVKKPFSNVIRCNIGDCHACGQTPITFLRQVCALVTYPYLLDDPNIPNDAKDRARRILDDVGGRSVGSYSESCGVSVIRQDIAKYIEERDGIPSDPKNIFLSTGASGAVKSILQLISSTRPGKERTGVMVPIPQYPLYSATNAEYNACQIDYYLNEEKGWGFTEEELERALAASQEECNPRVIVVINPGNPTGQVLDRNSIETVIKFAKRHSLLIMADEVYQHNIYVEGKSFLSFKKALHDLGPMYADQVELASFMSASKGFMGECGFRGGYCELVNFNPEVQAELFKCLTAQLCTSVIGQTMMDAVVNPPRKGEQSYVTYWQERKQVLSDLKFKAKLITDTLNSMEGFSCNAVEGAMYAFPQIILPRKAIKEAEAINVKPDFLYCKQLLEETGVCVVPGSGFGQVPGTYHFRATILPMVEEMKVVMDRIKRFHKSFMEKYA